MNGLDSLLDGVFDYAGMHPPASLNLDAALANACRFHQTLARPRLLAGHLVLGHDQTALLSREHLERNGFPQDGLFRLCLLGPRLLSQGMEAAAAAKQACELTVPFSVSSFEVKLPGVGPLENTTPEVLRILDALRGSSIRLFVEIEWTPAEWTRNAAQAFAWIRELCQKAGEGRVGLKVRGSGPTALTPEALASILSEVSVGANPFKATAGLHHPIVERSRYENLLGFLNLTAALRLRQCLGPKRFPREALLHCLMEDDSRTFRFDHGIAWKEFQAETGPLATAAKTVPFSIGSCSLDEPDQDLVRLFGRPAPVSSV